MKTKSLSPSKVAKGPLNGFYRVTFDTVAEAKAFHLGIALVAVNSRNLVCGGEPGEPVRSGKSVTLSIEDEDGVFDENGDEIP